MNADDKLKTCTRCRRRKPISEFNRRSRSPDGRQCHCRECAKMLRRQREAAKEAARKYADGIAAELDPRDY